MNAPAWMRCENCLWWVSGAEYGHPGCNYAQEEIIDRSGFSRCSEWTCKRCFEKWYQVETDPVNHLYCKIIARGKPKKGGKE